MSIRLDPRRVGVLKRLAGETGKRPGDLVRQWVEERLDAARQGIDTPDAARQLTAQLAELAERVATLEAAAGLKAPADYATESAPEAEPMAEPTAAPDAPEAGTAVDEVPDEEPRAAEEPDAAVAAEVETEVAAEDQPAEEGAPRKRTKRVAASPSGPRVALHDEMIAVLAERGPMSAGDLAAAVAERGRYQPPRSGKPLDAAMVSQRVSNPVYRARFTRSEGRIGLAESAE